MAGNMNQAAISGPEVGSCSTRSMVNSIHRGWDFGKPSAFWSLLVVLLTLAPQGVVGNTVLGISDNKYFTINGEPTFLYEMSYLGLTAIPTELTEVPPVPFDAYGSWTGVLIAQLEHIHQRGVNCVRVWTHWGHYLEDNACEMFPTPPNQHDQDHWDRIFSVTDTEGRCDNAPEDVRSLYQRNMNRLRKVIETCDDLGMIVELTFARPPFDIVWAWPFPQDHYSHCAAIDVVCDKMQEWRNYGHQFKNVYFDVDNESWGIPDGISVDDVAELIDIVKDVSHQSTDGANYTWICVCSGDWSRPDPPSVNAELFDSYVLAGADFVAPMMGGGQGDPENCMEEIRDLRDAMGQKVPIHVVEPFRVGNFIGAIPDESDFFRACTGAKAAGTVGWNLHNQFNANYGNYYVREGDLAYSCLGDDDMEQGDPEGITEVVLDDMFGHFGQPDALNPSVIRYQAEYDEQLRPNAQDSGHPVFSPVGARYPASRSYAPAPWGWEALPADGEGLITWGPDAHSADTGWGVATLHITWTGSAATKGKVATVSIYDRWNGGEEELGHGEIYGDDFDSPGHYVDISVPFYCSYSGADIDVDVNVLGQMALRLDYIQLALPSPAVGPFGSGARDVSPPALSKPHLFAWSTPNPFQHTTKLAFSLTVGSPVSLTVYDFSGREIERLVDNHTMEAGTHSVSWQPRILSGGIYACRFVAGEYAETTRLVYVGEE